MPVPGTSIHRRALPPLNAVKAFEAVARLGSLTLAAAELNVTPSAISQQIRLLEDRVGKKLFKTLSKGLTLTALGKKSYPQIREAIALIGSAFEPDDMLKARVAISTLPAMASRWLNSRLATFLSTQEELELYVDCSPRLIDFSEESFDMALRYGRGNYEPLSIDFLFKERFQAVCSPLLKTQIQERVKSRDFNAITFICDVGMTAGEHVTWKDWLERRCAIGYEPEKRMVCTDANMSIDAAVNGMGLLLGRHVLISDLIEQGVLVVLDEEPFETELGYFLVYPSLSRLSPQARDLRNWIVQCASAMRDKHGGLDPIHRT